MATKNATAATKCRVLRECAYGAPDTVVTLAGEELASAVAGGAVDSDPAAVAYAESLVVAEPAAE